MQILTGDERNKIMKQESKMRDIGIEEEEVREEEKSQLLKGLTLS